MIDIIGMDIEEMQNRLQCDDDRCLDIIITFYTDISKKFAQLCKTEDNIKFITLAHGIKGSCANVGATQCSECARILEEKARAQDMTFCGEELKNLYINLRTVLKNVYVFLKYNS